MRLLATAVSNVWNRKDRVVASRPRLQLTGLHLLLILVIILDLLLHFSFFGRRSLLAGTRALRTSFSPSHLGDFFFHQFLRTLKSSGEALEVLMQLFVNSISRIVRDFLELGAAVDIAASREGDRDDAAEETNLMVVCSGQPHRGRPGRHNQES